MVVASVPLWVCHSSSAERPSQLPGSGEQTGGRPDRALQLAKAAAAIGVHALFVECHPNPKEAWSDGATQVGFDLFEQIISSAAAIRPA